MENFPFTPPVPVFALTFYRRSSLSVRFPLIFVMVPGWGRAAGAGVPGALLPGNAGGGGPGLVHPLARPQQPGSWAAAAAAQRPVGQRSPQQPGGSSGESERRVCVEKPALELIRDRWEWSVWEELVLSPVSCPCACRGRASWIPKLRSLSQERNTRSPPHPHGACTRTPIKQSSYLKRLWRPRPSTH